MASTPSQFGSSMRAAAAGGVALGVGVAADVDGVAAGGERGQALACSLASVSGLSSASSPPRASRRSVAMTPGPPALVTMPSVGPRGLETRDSASLASNRSSISSTRTTPARRKAAL